MVRAEEWAIGDLHINHNNIIKFSRTQFSSVKEHDEYMLETINSIVKPEDKLHLLGDLFFGTDIEYLDNFFSKLHGKKYHYIGNHDTREKNKALEKHMQGVYQSRDLHYKDKKILIMHHPVHPQQMENRYVAQIHAHTHNDKIFRNEFVTTTWDGEKHTPVFNQVKDERYICVSAEQIDMKPINFSELYSRIKNNYGKQ